MTHPETPQTARRVQIKDDGDRIVAEAEVTTARGPAGTVRTSMYAKDPYVAPAYRSSLVDAVMDLPEVQASERVEATIPYGDAESLARLRERTQGAQTRAAGATTLLDADIPSPGTPADERPEDGTRPAGQ